MTTSTSPSEWFHHLYNHSSPTTTTTTTTLSGQPSDSTVISTTVTANTTANYSFRRHDARPESRVSRPARRRPRASRKNPTTLLNTDTTNFRAMVQRYTGGNMAYSTPPAAGFGFHQGQIGNFNHMQGSMGGVDLRASQLHQPLMMQQQHGFGSTADMGSLGSEIPYSNSTSTSTSSMGDENKRGGFMF